MPCSKKTLDEERSCTAFDVAKTMVEHFENRAKTSGTFPAMLLYFAKSAHQVRGQDGNQLWLETSPIIDYPFGQFPPEQALYLYGR